MAQTIFISGASQGIGLAVALRFLKEGYTVGICARNAERLATLKAQYEGLYTFTCDVSDKLAIKHMVKQIHDKMGKIDILVNNAGRFVPGNIHEEEDEVYETMLRTNLDSAYYLTKGLLPPMIAAQSGAIVNITSIAGLGAYPGGSAYSISKFAMIGFSHNLRHELKDKGIRVIQVAPGATFTASWAGIDIDPERLMPAEDIADLIFDATALSGRTVVEEIVVRPQLGDL